jgi:hypothetical protein
VHEIYDFGTQKGFFLDMKKNAQEPATSLGASPLLFLSHDFVVVQASGDVQRNV